VHLSAVRDHLVLPALALAALGVGACGSGSSNSGAGGKSSHGKSRTGLHGRIYRVRLTGNAETPPGPPNGTGNAVIALHSSLDVCWRFSHLHGFTGATFAHIHRGAAGTSGPVVIPLSTSPKLHHKGCVRSTAAQLKAIEKDPSGYYVNIHSRKYPAGAVRSQL
jgi:hypothetical protein